MGWREEHDPTREELLARIAELETALERVAMERDEMRWHVEALHKAREALEESRERYADLYDFAPNGYVTLDDGGTVLDINLTGAELIGLPRPNIVGMPLFTWVAPSNRRLLRDHMRQCRDSGELVATELSLKLPRSGGVVPVELISKSHRIEAGRWVHRSVMADLRDRRKVEAERQRLVVDKERAESASESKGRFLAVLSHELRTPLTPIVAATAELEASAALPAELRKTVAMIRRNAELEARLIDDLLDVTRIERDKLDLVREPVDLYEIVTGAVSICAEEVRRAGLDIEVVLDAPRAIVDGDRTRLHQVFWNLLINATRYTPEGGRIQVRSRVSDGSVVVRISDTGEGMEKATLDRVFSAFEQGTRGRRGGLGLGLSISRGLVDAHGGRLSASSEGAGMGSTFEVELPLARSERLRPLASSVVPRREGGATVLLVEDHEDSAEALSRMLTRAGYVVRVAHSAREARETMASDVDVVVSDIGLPDGSGIDLLTELRKIQPAVAIALSGYGAAADRRATRDAGFAAHLTKPVTYRELVDAIESARAGPPVQPGDASSIASASADRPKIR